MNRDVERSVGMEVGVPMVWLDLPPPVPSDYPIDAYTNQGAGGGARIAHVATSVKGALR